MVGFEAGFSKYGQTHEDLLLAHTMGVKQIVICINKMDVLNMPYCERRFNEIFEKRKPYLSKIGYNNKKIEFIPTSGLVSDNMINSSKNKPWFKGPCILQALNNLQLPGRPVDKPLRLPFQDVY